MPSPRVSRLIARAHALGRHNPRGVSQTSSLVDANRAAEMLGVPLTWLLAQARAGQIPHHRLCHYVRFDLDELIDWLNHTRTRPDDRHGRHPGARFLSGSGCDLGR